MFDLSGKCALVTGASKGIGRGVAEALAAEGCALHLASRTEAALAQAKAEIESAHGVGVEIHPCDLSQTGAAEALAEILVKHVPSDLWPRVGT